MFQVRIQTKLISPSSWIPDHEIFSLLNWHSQLVKVTGDGAIVRVLTDRRRLWLAILRMTILIGQIKNGNFFAQTFLKSALDLNFNQKKNFLASHKFIPRDFIPNKDMSSNRGEYALGQAYYDKYWLLPRNSAW